MSSQLHMFDSQKTKAPMTREDALRLVDCEDIAGMRRDAVAIRNRSWGKNITYSPKVFIPLTQLCRNSCAYCTFAHPAERGRRAYLMKAEVLAIARAGAAMGCTEALFTLGDRPEDRYRLARDELLELGYASTIEYLAAMATSVFEETGLLPHLNMGIATADEIRRLRRVSVSQGLMLETVSDRLTEKGNAHYACPDKVPAVRLQHLRDAGEARVPMTTGILIGIGETRLERIESLLAIQALHTEFGHIQEVIVQNFRAKGDTRMAEYPEPPLEDILWTVAATRLILDESISVQVPPNLNPNDLEQLLDSGINDFGGISPITIDHVNPEAPWPEVASLSAICQQRGLRLVPRLALYPRYLALIENWVAPGLHSKTIQHSDSEGYARFDSWSPGVDTPLQGYMRETARAPLGGRVSQDVRNVLAKLDRGEAPNDKDILELFVARDADLVAVCEAADNLRRSVSGEEVGYVVTRNINYTNICSYKCTFCAFSKGKTSDSLRGRPYDIDDAEISRRAREAWARGATEVCLQGGIHPDYTGQRYLDICRAVKRSAPNIHVHAFSPLEVSHGASTLGISVREFLLELKSAGLNSLPGTAAEILHDDVRAVICPDKLNTSEWLNVIREAHEVGLRTTATIMFGHVDSPVHWAAHLLAIRALQCETGGFTEFVPLPFVHMQSPMYLRNRARKGPTSRETILMHAVARLALHPVIRNIQTSWVKLGPSGAAIALACGVNDLGGTLMDESITRAAGSEHGQEFSPQQMLMLIKGLGRVPRQRTTLYQTAPQERTDTSFSAPALSPRVEMLVRREKPTQRSATA